MKIYPLCIVAALTVLSVACQKSKSCKENHSIKGDIVKVVDVSCPISTEKQIFIIEDDSSYQQLLKQVTENNSCTLPEIDFEKETLLGHFTSGNCDASFHGNVVKDASKKKYTYSIKVKECGNCKSLVYSYNWVTIPKLLPDWNVEFKIEK